MTTLEDLWAVTLSKTDVQEISYALGVGDEQAAVIELFYNNDLPSLVSPAAVPDKKLAYPSHNGLTSSLGVITAATGTANTLTGIDTVQTITAPVPGTSGQSGIVSFTFDGDLLSGSNAYYLDTPGAGGQATVQFCLRVTNEATDGTDVMYRELALEYTLDFDGTITGSNSLLLDAFTATEAAETTSIGVTAFFCDAAGVVLSAGALATPINQGDSVYLCVESDSPTLARVNTIDELEVTADNGGTPITQTVVTGGADNSFSTMTCALGKCSVEIFLTADFYPSLADAATLTLTSSGTAELLVGARRLRGEITSRQLADNNYEQVDFEAERTTYATAMSGANQVSSVAFGTVAIAVAAMML